MKIRELLEAEEGQKNKKAASNLPSINDEPEDDVEDDDHDRDSKENDDGEAIELGDLEEYAAEIGDDLWSVSVLGYDGLSNRISKPEVFRQLRKTAKTLGQLSDSIGTLKSASSGRTGSVSAIIVNALNGESCVFYVEPGTEPRVIPDSFLDGLEMNQATAMNRILDAGSRYSAAMVKFLDNPDSYARNNQAEDRQEQLLDALNYSGQKFPQGKMSAYDKWSQERSIRREKEKELERASKREKLGQL